MAVAARQDLRLGPGRLRVDSETDYSFCARIGNSLDASMTIEGSTITFHPVESTLMLPDDNIYEFECKVEESAWHEFHQHVWLQVDAQR